MKTRNIIIGAVVVLVVIVIAVGAFAYMGARALAEGPYSISKRPMPSGTDVAALLPQKVGAFTRGDIAESGTDYSDGQTQVSVAVSIKNSPAEAQAAVKGAAAVAGGDKTSLTGTDPSYLRQIYSSQARMLYTRGAYVFDVQTTSGDALDKFMTSFPY